MSRVCVIMLGGGKQQECFWPSYYNCTAGYPHDLVVIHRNKLGLPINCTNVNGDIFYHNKINVDGKDIPHKAFGAYRHFFNIYKEFYNIFVFISDDVIIKRDNWLLDIVSTLSSHERLGFGASQIFNGGKAYPHESHLRAPFWFAKTTALLEAKWEFNSDHEGEMLIGQQLTDAGYFGVQVGNKLDLAFDATEDMHITQILEKAIFPDKHPYGKYLETNQLERIYNTMPSPEEITIRSPWEHIGEQGVFIDLEPFNGLIFQPSLEIAKKYVNVIDIGHNIHILG